jgi:hypothetical protein
MVGNVFRAGALTLAIVTGLTLTASSATASPGATPDLPAPTSTASVSGPGTGVASLVDVRTGRHDGYDRVGFASTGGTPGYRVGYGTLVAGGTGDPIPLAGKASLVVVFTPASAPGYDIRQVINPGLPTVKQIKFGEDFEGYVSAGLGLADKVGFRVLVLHNPDRIAIDVAHPPGNGCTP